MPLESLTTGYYALVVNRMAYCLSAWGGFLSVEDEKTASTYFFSALSDMASLTQFIMLQVCVNTLTERCLNLYKLKVILPPVRSDIGNLEIAVIFLLCLNVQLSRTKFPICLDACSILFNCCKFCVYAYYTCH
jgi:hypothetical protein